MQPETTYPDVIDFQAMEPPGTIDPVHYVPHRGCSVIERIKDATTKPAWKRPRQSIQLDIWVSLSTHTNTCVMTHDEVICE